MWLDSYSKGDYIQTMAEIKSALELALERTAGMEVDKSKLQEKEFKVKGRKAALAFLEGKTEIAEFSKTLKQQKGDGKEAFKKGAAGSFMSILKLPIDTDYKPEFMKAADGLAAISDSKGSIKQMFEQLVQFFDQYLQNREQMEKQLAAQYQPVLKQKEEAIFAQTGSRIKLDPMDDPDFQKAYSQNIGNLSKNYLEALNQAKEQLRNFLDIEE